MIDGLDSEDFAFFTALLCGPRETLASYATLFDFRPPRVKRLEFNAARAGLLSRAIQRDGADCRLAFPGRCDLSVGCTLDHLIPLSSNVLNKRRGMRAEVGRKVPTQSFGSNHLDNLVVACGPCNAYKKHRFLSPEQIQDVLSKRKPCR
jgi:hypothetical protein